MKSRTATAIEQKWLSCCAPLRRFVRGPARCLRPSSLLRSRLHWKAGCSHCQHRLGGGPNLHHSEAAADTLVKAAEDFDQAALSRIFGPDGKDIVFSGEVPQDRKHALDFAQEAEEKLEVSVDPKTANRAFLFVGNEDWPFPFRSSRRGEWSFDSKAGRRNSSIAASAPMSSTQSRSVTGTWKHRRCTLSSPRGLRREPVRAAHHQHARHAGRPRVAEFGWHLGRPHRRENRQGHRAGL